MAKFPAIGRIVPESKAVPESGIIYIREILSGNYRIIYQVVSSEQIDIITFHHSSMELKEERLNRHNILSPNAKFQCAVARAQKCKRAQAP